MLEASDISVKDSSMVRMAAPTVIYSLSVYKNAGEKLNAALGVILPVRAELWRHGGVTYLWSGPGSWLVLGGDTGLADRARDYAAVTEQSDGRVVFTVTGPQVRRALSKLVPIDLHEAAFPENATALTLAGHINVQLWREDKDGFALTCFRSFANALYDALIDACLEFES